MSYINAYATGESNDLYICGEHQIIDSFTNDDIQAHSDSSVEFRAVLSKMSLSTGNVNWLIEGTGTHPLYDGVNFKNQDLCKGITYDKSTSEISVLIQGKMGEIRTDDKGNFFDAIILRLSSSGEIRKMLSITQGGYEIDFHMASRNALV